MFFFWHDLLLRGLDTLGRFSAIFYKGDIFCDFLFACMTIPFLKVGYRLGKNLASNLLWLYEALGQLVTK